MEKTEKKGYILFAAIVVIAVIVIYLMSSCAPSENIITTSSTSINTVLVEKLVNNMNYSLDYVEDESRNVGCYVYDGTDSGSIYCFKLDQ
jgi:hypothetical protein